MTGAGGSTPTKDPGASADFQPDALSRRLRAAFWILAVLLGGLQAWEYRNYSSDDTVACLDLSDAFFRGDWKLAFNAHWHPLVPMLIALARKIYNPPSYDDFVLVQIVTFAVYLASIRCFEFFWRSLIDSHHRSSSFAGKLAGLSYWAWLTLGYVIWLWTSLTITTLFSTIQDIAVSAYLYLASGMVVRIRMGHQGVGTFALLGAVLGYGYWTKAPLFVMGFVFLAVGYFAVADRRRAVPRVLLSLVIFLGLSIPLIGILSRSKGRWTLGGGGELVYAWFVNGTPVFYNWQGEAPNVGVPKHPTRKLFDRPAVYEYAAPIRGTYPPWYDPAYWNAGLEPHFSVRQQLAAIGRGLTVYYTMISSQGFLVAGILILFLMGEGGAASAVKAIARNWHLLVPALAGFAGYALIHVEPRYVGGFLVLLWAGIISAVRLPESGEARKLAARVTLALAMLLGGAALAPEAYLLVAPLRSPVRRDLAQGLARLGVRPGDTIAIIGNAPQSYWARLARVRIVAEVPPQDVRCFWSAAPSVKSEIMNLLAKTGAKTVVAEDVPPPALLAAWQRVGSTDDYAYFFSR